MRNLLILFLLCSLLCGITWQPAFAQLHKASLFQLSESANYLPGRIICKVKPSFRDLCSPTQLQFPGLEESLQSIEHQGTGKVFPKINPPIKDTDRFGQALIDLSLVYVIEFDTAISVEKAVNIMLRHKEFAYCEPWYIADIFYQPNDPFADTTGSVQGQWHLNQIKARQAWDIEKGEDSDIVIGVVDTGISFDHPDMQGNIAHNLLDPIDGIDNDNDGYVDNYRGWDFGGPFVGSQGDNDPTYTLSSHGVGVAGTFGATTDNGIGTAGVCFNCGYLPIKATDDAQGGVAYGYSGIIYAVEQGLPIVNCSWGSSQRSKFGEDVVNYATINREAALIVACGNSGNEEKFYPAAYERALSVANSLGNDDPLDASSTFDYSVDVSAPGIGIWTPFQSNTYQPLPGTSFSAPITAGVTALTMGAFPNLTGFQAAQRVRVTSDDHYVANAAKFGKAGKGRVNALRAITDPLMPSIRYQEVTALNSRGSSSIEPGDTIEIRGNFVNYLHPAANLQMSISPSSESAPYVQIVQADQLIGPVAMNQTFEVNNTPFQLILNAGVPIDFQTHIRITYTDTITGYSDFEYTTFWVNRSYLDITVHDLQTTITSKGNFGFNDFGPQEQGLGVGYNGFDNSLFEGGFLVGKSLFEVADNIRKPAQSNDPIEQDNDFFVSGIVHRVSSNLSDFESSGKMTGILAEFPMALEVEHKAYAFAESGHENFVIFSYRIRNDDAIPMNNLYAGLFADWDIAVISDNDIRDACSYDMAQKLGFAYGLAGGNGNYYGISLLSPEDFKAFATSGDGGFVFDDPGKYLAISNNPTAGTATVGVNTGGEDIMHFVSGGPFSLNPQEERTVAFAVMAGDIYQDLIDANAAAREKYRCVILGEGPTEGFSLSDTLVAPGSQIQFSDQNAPIASSLWEFGDGQTGSGAITQHSYAQPGVYTIFLTSSDGNCEVRSRRTVIVDNSVSVEEFMSTGTFSISPNPAKNKIQLNWDTTRRGSYQLAIHTISGAKIWATDLHKSSQEWSGSYSLEGFASGLYFISVSNDQFRITRKLVIE